jgi:hypothetical protein
MAGACAAIAERAHIEQHGAHVDLVAGVGVRPVLEVGDEGGLAGVEEGILQAPAPRDGVGKGRDGAAQVESRY